MHVDVLNLGPAFEQKQSMERSAASAGVKHDLIEGVDGRHLRDEQTQGQKNSVRRTGKICWSDLLLFMAVAGCILSAAGLIATTLSLVAVMFLLGCSLVLTGVMLFWLLCPVSIPDVLANLRFRAEGSSRFFEKKRRKKLLLPLGLWR
jgi:hypothetical protein